MLRRKQAVSSNGGNNDHRQNQKQQHQQQHANGKGSSHDNDDDDDDDDSRGRSKSFLPKNAIVSLFFLAAFALFLISYRYKSSLKGNHYSISNAVTVTVTATATNNNVNINTDNSRGLRIQSLSNNPNENNKSTDDHQNTLSPTTQRTLHILFSTDCSTFQHWQSYLFFHAAHTISQPGYITRIASGCSESQKKDVLAWHLQHVQNGMSARYRIHFTPHFSGVKDEVTGEIKGDYKFFNKPFGLKHFLEFGEFMGLVDEDTANDANTGGTAGEEIMKMKDPNSVIILCDPDFLLMRPLTDDFSNEKETIVSPRRRAFFENQQKEQQNQNQQQQQQQQSSSRYIVSHGHPFAQTYGLGTQWRKFGIDAITNSTNSPAKDVDQTHGQLLYPAGPPYIGTAEDMYKIAVKWSEFAPRVHKEYPHLLAEMYAYCIAAAHVQLPHILIDSMMISSAGVGGEGWKFIQDIPSLEICPVAAHPTHSHYPLPNVIHFCQRYEVDKYFYAKRKVPHDIFTCDFPLLVEPPMNLGSGKYLSFVPNGRPESERKEMSPEKEKMQGFVVCALTKAVNEASLYFKERHCEGGGNRRKVYDMWAGKDVSKVE